MYEINLLEKGWECPKCGAVMSPSTSVCVNCRGVSTETIITTNTTPTVLSPEDVRKMSPQEVRDNYNNIMNSMKSWGTENDHKTNK